MSLLMAQSATALYVKPSDAPFSFLPRPLPLRRPRRRLSPAPTAVLSQGGARRCCQGWPLLQRPPPPRASAFTAIEHDGRLDGSGVAYTPVCCLSVSSVSANYS